MNDLWNRISWQPQKRYFVADDEPSDISPSSGGGILGNLGQFTEMRPVAQFQPPALWGAPVRPTASTWAQWPARPSVEAYDPEALKFAAAWRRMYLNPQPPVFGPANDPSPWYGRSSNNEFLSPVAHAEDWPQGAEIDGANDSVHAAAVIPAGYQIGATPWWAPVPPPDVFNPRREHASKGLLGLYKFFFDRGPYPSGANRNGPGCKEEWDAAREDCAEELSKPNPNRRFTGGYRNVEDCARGHVSERCGGNPIDR